jgi:hypothetical protein
MNGHQTRRIDRRGRMRERIKDYSFGVSFLRDLCLQPGVGEKNG